MLHSNNLSLGSTTLSLSTHVLWHLLECLPNLSFVFAGTRLGLVGRLSVLQFFEGSCLRGRADFALLRRLLFDVFQRCANDSPLHLARTTISLFRGGFSQAFLVETSPSLRPHQFGSLFTLDGETVGLGRTQPDGSAIATNHEFTISGINSVLGKSA